MQLPSMDLRKSKMLGKPKPYFDFPRPPMDTFRIYLLFVDFTKIISLRSARIVKEIQIFYEAINPQF